MSELLIIGKVLIMILIVILTLLIVIPLSFWIYNRPKVLMIFKKIVFSILFLAIAIYTHRWDNSPEYLIWYWSLIISFGIIFLPLIWFALPKQEERRIR